MRTPLQVWRDRRARRDCMHHKPGSADRYTVSWVRGELIDLGRRKMWTCTECGQVWFT